MPDSHGNWTRSEYQHFIDQNIVGWEVVICLVCGGYSDAEEHIQAKSECSIGRAIYWRDRTPER